MFLHDPESAQKLFSYRTIEALEAYCKYFLTINYRKISLDFDSLTKSLILKCCDDNASYCITVFNDNNNLLTLTLTKFRNNESNEIYQYQCCATETLMHPNVLAARSKLLVMNRALTY